MLYYIKWGFIIFIGLFITLVGLTVATILIKADYASERVAQKIDAGRVDEIQKIIQEPGFDINKKFYTNEHIEANTTLLHLAASARRPDLIKVLLNAGADPNCLSKLQRTPLINTVGTYTQSGQECAEMLIKNGANLNCVSQMQGRPEYTPLIKSIQFSRKGNQFVKLLLDSGADPNLSINDKTPLFVAVEELPEDSNGLEIIGLLLAKGADPLKKSPQGSSALEYAKQNSKTKFLALLEKK